MLLQNIIQSHKGSKKNIIEKLLSSQKKKIKTTWNIIHKEISNPTNEKNIKSIRINNYLVYNQIRIAN